MVVQLAHAPLPVAPAVGALSLAVAGGVRGQGLGIPWPLLVQVKYTGVLQVLGVD